MSYRELQSSPDPRLLHLIGGVLDGDATTPERQELDQCLRSDRAARAAYCSYVNLHVALRIYGNAGEQRAASPSAGEQNAAVAAVRSIAARATAARPARRPAALRPNIAHSAAASSARLPAWRWIPIGPVAGALAAAALIALLVWFPSPTPLSPSAAAEVGHFNRVNRIKLAGSASVPEAGSPIQSGVLELSDGLAEITLNNGVRMVLEAPVKLDLSQSGVARLLDGRLVATVPPDARGFTILTPRARVIDLGTEFGVGVSSSGKTQVQVFRGLVVTEWQESGKKLEQRLTAGAALGIDAAPQSAPHSIPFTPEQFVRTFPTEGSDFQPSGPIYSRSQFDSIQILPAPAGIKIDGDLSDWNRSASFYSACQPPYDKSHNVTGMMMYDHQRLYIGAHVSDPFPMRSTVDPANNPGEYAWRGGSVIVRLSVNRKLGSSLTAMSPGGSEDPDSQAGHRPEDLSNQIIHATLWYHQPSGKPRLLLSYGMDFHGELYDPPGWEGAFRIDPDRQGYTVEYAIPWSLLHAEADPPRQGDVLATCWTVHWSDAAGKLSRGYLVEINTVADDKFPFLRASTWGKAIYK